MKAASILCVGLGGFLGSVLRYLVFLAMQAKGWTAFPWATLIVNIAGCFLITFLLTIAAAITMRTNLQLFLTTGIMGGLTTYSTFDYETTRLFQNGTPVTALANVGATLVACFVAGLLGLALARVLVAD